MSITIQDDLFKTLQKDYRDVIREVNKSSAIPTSIKFATNNEPVKPFTITNLIISNQLDISREKRIACAALVDVSGRLITLLDDIIDNHTDRINAQINSKYTLKSETPHFIIAVELPFIIFSSLLNPPNLFNDEKKLEIMVQFLVSARILVDGLKWQQERGCFTTFGENLPDIEIFLEEYVDKIAGGLFGWSLVAIKHYEERVGTKIDILMKGIKSFSRIFQINDDIVDLIEDMNAGQYSTALIAILAYGTKEEIQKMSQLSKIDKKKLSQEEFNRYFPTANKKLSEIKEREYNILDKSLQEIDIGITINLVREFDRDYQSIRQSLTDGLIKR